MSQELVRLTIDGRAVEVPRGTLLVEAAKAAGIDVPVFCYHPKLDPVGVCRMCLVEVEGQRKPVTACTLPVGPDMVVHTTTERVKHLQNSVLEYLLLHHPLDCPVCDKGGECPLQDQTFKFGLPASRMSEPKRRKPKAVDLGPFIVLDEERCVLCRRCTRFDAEVTGERNLVIGERAHEALVTTARGEPYRSYFGGNTVELCPVGALTSKVYRFRSRPWDVSHHPSVCTGCPVGCHVDLNFRHGRLTRILARAEPAVDDGWLCDRGRFNHRYLESEERLLQPLVRRNGELVAVTWTEALQEAGRRLAAIRAEHGGDALAVLGGGRLTNEEAYLLQKLARRVFGTPHLDHRVAGGVTASVEGFEGRIADLDDADVILSVDLLAQERIPVVDLRVRKAVSRRGAKLILVGSALQPYGVPHLAVAAPPGQTAATLAALSPAKGKGGRAKEAAAEPAAAAAALARGKRVVALWGGEDRAVGRALVSLLKALRARGAQVSLLIAGEQANSRGAEFMGVRPDLLPGLRPLADPGARQALAAHWGGELPAGPGLDTRGILEGCRSGAIQGLLVAGANPVETFPDGRLARQALAAVPFLVVQELFLTETARLADVVLPAAPFPAKAGSFTNLEGRVEELVPALGPDGDSRADLTIFRALSQAMGGPPLVGSEQEFAWELQHLVEPAVREGRVPGAPAALLEGEAPGTPDGGEGDLVLIAVDRLFGGGGTARFDPKLQGMRPEACARLHPTDSERLQLEPGAFLELDAGEEACVLRVEVAPDVQAGTVQVPRGLPGAAVNRLLAGSLWAPVRARRRVLEEVG